MTSHRASLIDASGIRKVFDLAQKMENPINLSIGQPDFDVPEIARQAAIEAIEQGNNRYTQTQGIPELLEKLAVHTRANGYDPEAYLVTSGVSGAISLALLAIFDPGDEILVPDPYFVMYKHVANLYGVKPVFFDTYPDFRMRAEAMEPLITERTKALIVNSPANPTGVSMEKEELEAVVELARKHDLIILSDEIYDCFSYDDEHLSPAKLYERTVVLNGFSKTHAMTGWRLGYAMGPKDIIQEMTKLQQYTFVCAPSPSQYAGLVALDHPMDAAYADYRKKRDLIYNGLKDKFNVVKPSGAFYIFPEAPGGMTGTDFCLKAVENEVLIIPGGVFSERDTHFRISFAASEENLKKGLEILNSLA